MSGLTLLLSSAAVVWGRAGMAQPLSATSSLGPLPAPIWKPLPDSLERPPQWSIPAIPSGTEPSWNRPDQPISALAPTWQWP